ncbi:class I SAM-dependent methyltransferase [Streptomyces sp. NPDC002851]
MTQATDHYDRLLAEHYSWMLGGDVHELAAAQTSLLKELGVGAGAGVDGPEEATEAAEETLAVDLGCGPGQQSLALADLGFTSVLAVDTSRRLLDELTHHASATATTTIRPLHADIRGVLPEHTRPGTVSTVVCMGDTLTHLPSKQDVTTLLGEITESLTEGGQLIISYRDLTNPLKGTDRFLPVRSTPDRIMTCFLEYADEDKVTVHDLIHERTGDTWTLHTSSYPKLRISSAWLTQECRTAGLRIQHDAVGPRGMHIISAVK